MLVSYQKDGEFEFRSPRREFCFSGQTGGLMLEFFDYAADELHRAASTVYSYQFTLDMLNRYLERRNLSVNDISADVIECFLKESSSTIRARILMRTASGSFSDICITVIIREWTCRSMFYRITVIVIVLFPQRGITY